MSTPFTFQNPEVPIGLGSSRPQVKVAAVGFTPSTDGFAKYRTNTNGITTDYMVHNRFEKDHHRYMAGITSPGGFENSSAAFFQLASPTLLWIAQWTGLTIGAHPKMPHPNQTDANWVLLDEHVEPVMVTVPADGSTPLYRVNGCYVYGHKNPSDLLIRNIGFPIPPWLDPDIIPVVEVGFTEHDLMQGIINPGTGSRQLYRGIIPRPLGG